MEINKPGWWETELATGKKVAGLEDVKQLTERHECNY